MRQKSQKGFSLLELITVVAIILIMAAVAIPNLFYPRQQREYFQESFGIKIRIFMQPSEQEHQIIQPLITKRLQELRNNLQIAQKEKADLLISPETVTPEEVTQKTDKLYETEARIISTSTALARAEESAEYFGFNIQLF